MNVSKITKIYSGNAADNWNVELVWMLKDQVMRKNGSDLYPNYVI